MWPSNYTLNTWNREEQFPIKEVMQLHPPTPTPTPPQSIAHAGQESAKWPSAVLASWCRVYIPPRQSHQPSLDAGKDARHMYSRCLQIRDEWDWVEEKENYHQTPSKTLFNVRVGGWPVEASPWLGCGHSWQIPGQRRHWHGYLLQLLPPTPISHAPQAPGMKNYSPGWERVSISHLPESASWQTWCHDLGSIWVVWKWSLGGVRPLMKASGSIS